MKVAVPKETYPGEQRVALIPVNIPQLAKAGMDVIVESGAGVGAGFDDAQYEAKGATITTDRAAIFSADVVAQVRTLGANPKEGRDDLPRMKAGGIVLGSCDPLGEPAAAKDVAETGSSLFSLEMIPRITRAQSMDVLSSMATIAGYRAVLLAAIELPKIFPMLMTAAGTLKPARVFVIGAGVAGLQAIATAKRLGAVVRAYDVRPACREQVESLGGKFVELKLETEQSEDKGGYAKAMDEAFYVKQRELMAEVVAESDIVITTAAIPGKTSPLLITAEAVAGMTAGSVIVDMATERGGNCALSQADKRVVEHGVVILGPTNLPAEIPNHASQMFSNNVTKFLLNLVKDGEVDMNLEDEIIRDTLIAHGGEVVNGRVRGLLGLEPLDTPERRMNASFDPYTEWLNIPLANRPPSEYELLGLRNGESDADRITDAYQARYAIIRKYQIGAYSEIAQRVLDELSSSFQTVTTRAFEQVTNHQLDATDLPAETEVSQSVATADLTNITTPDHNRESNQCVPTTSRAASSQVESEQSALDSEVPSEDTQEPPPEAEDQPATREAEAEDDEGEAAKDEKVAPETSAVDQDPDTTVRADESSNDVAKEGSE